MTAAASAGAGNRSNAVQDALIFLFVPGDRPERFAKALAAGADAVVLDLEDGVTPEGKAPARDGIAQAASAIEQAPCPVLVRVNPAGTPFHAGDLRLVAALPVAGVVLAKAESEESALAVADGAGKDRAVIALIESAAGLASARSIAGITTRLAFGSIDYAADIGCSHTREALLAARSELVLASRLAGHAGPIDGVTPSFQNEALVEADAAHAASLGFTGKLLIHPAQIAPAVRGFVPSADEIAWAKRVLAATRDGGAAAVDGAMVDLAVRLRAEQIMGRAARASTR